LETKPQTLGKILLSALLSAYLALSCGLLEGPVPLSFADALQSPSSRAAQSVGVVGSTLASVSAWFAGPWLRWGLVLLPWFWVPLERRSKGKNPPRSWPRWVAAATWALALAGMLGHPALAQIGAPVRAGGALGGWIYAVTSAPTGTVGSFLILAGIWAFLTVRALPPIRLELPWWDRFWGWLGGSWSRGPAQVVAAVRRMSAATGRLTADAWDRLRDRFDGEDLPLSEPEPGWEAENPRTDPRPEPMTYEPSVMSRPHDGFEPLDDGQASEASPEEELNVVTPPSMAKPPPTMPQRPSLPHVGGEDPEFHLSRDPAELLVEESVPRSKQRRRRREPFPLPGADILQSVEKEERGFSREVLQMNARLLLETLSSFGIEGRINEVRPGPVVTTFEFEPGPGVKVNQITSRADDLALAMRAIRIRIVAPIPGKAAVGIEVPNPFPQMVTLKDVVGPLMADSAVTPLTIGLGKDTEGNFVAADISDMPHLLVAGATGSGKSVCLNGLICSLLLRNGPDRLRMLMIDPKMLELSVYNGIPHLLHPVITDHKEALKALKYMVAEMSARYSALAKHGVRNLLDFNEKVKAGKIKDATGHRVDETMPYIVVIVDELADLMMLLGSELETPIARLAQMARAVGIHLVLATQRPSVNVITGVIKANFPSRIGFRVISKVDSRTILDVMGAEQLLGKGDSLFMMAGMTQPTRVHGAFLSMEECEAISDYWREFTEEESRLELAASADGTGGLDLGEDDLLDDAKRIVVLAQSGSTSMLQRKLRVGYTRAARLMDMLEESGVVGPFEGSKAREVLVRPDELEAEG